MKTRGVVITGNTILSDNDTALNINLELNKEIYLKYLTYWDEIHYVGTSVYGTPDFQNNSDYGTLIKEEILHVNEVNFTPEQNNRFFLVAMEVAQIDYYSKINQLRNDMKFSLGQSCNVLNLPQQNMTTVDCVELSIENILPIPINCSFADVLEFKEKRRSELLALRIRIEELKRSIDTLSKDEIILFKEKLEKSLIDICKVMDESKFQKVLTSMKTYLNISDSGLLGALMPTLGYLSSAASGYTYHPLVGTMGGFFANGLINLAIKKENKILGLSNDVQDFAYIYYLNKMNR